jgi:molecular chaperone GrpE
MAEQNDGVETQASAGPQPPEEAASRTRWRKRDEARRHEHSGSTPQGTAAAPSGASEAGVEASYKEQLAAEQEKTEEVLGRLQRTQADFANYKRRSEQEREQQAKFATQLLVQEMLPVLDNIDRVLSTMPESVRGLPWTEGLLLVDRHLRATLEKQGLKTIESVGSRFDPMLHEAIIHEESSDHADDEIIAELRRGYTLHDRVVRPTLVKVAKHVGETTKTTGESI